MKNIKVPDNISVDEVNKMINDELRAIIRKELLKSTLIEIKKVTREEAKNILSSKVTRSFINNEIRGIVDDRREMFRLITPLIVKEVDKLIPLHLDRIKDMTYYEIRNHSYENEIFRDEFDIHGESEANKYIRDIVKLSETKIKDKALKCINKEDVSLFTMRLIHDQIEDDVFGRIKEMHGILKYIANL